MWKSVFSSSLIFSSSIWGYDTKNSYSVHLSAKGSEYDKICLPNLISFHLFLLSTSKPTYHLLLLNVFEYVFIKLQSLQPSLILSLWIFMVVAVVTVASCYWLKILSHVILFFTYPCIALLCDSTSSAIHQLRILKKSKRKDE